MSVASKTRINWLRTIVAWSVAVLFVRILGGIVWEYQWYFPADFKESAFLTGRRQTFVGLYSVAFYAHIISGPFVLVIAIILMLSGRRSRFRRLHRVLGRTQMMLVLMVLVPSGLVMAREALTGPIAGFGFAALSIATAICAVVATIHVRARRIAEHRLWATRLFVLLASPLLLRLISGVMIVANFEPDWAYQLNAWLSWLIPWAIFEIHIWQRTNRDSLKVVRPPLSTTKGLSP